MRAAKFVDKEGNVVGAYASSELKLIPPNPELKVVSMTPEQFEAHTEQHDAKSSQLPSLQQQIDVLKEELANLKGNKQ